MLVLCIAGCRNIQKKVYVQSDLKEEIKDPSKDVDWIGIYIRCHELDSLKNAKLKNGGALKDIAPTVLHLLGLQQPADMEGENLLGEN